MPEARERQWKNIGDRIKEARNKLGLTQAQLGLQVGVSSQTVWAWESGRVKPTHEHLEELAFRCQVSTAWLLGRDVLEAELLKEASVSFHDAVEGLPLEDVETIQNFINFVRQERRRRTEAGE
jgi:transcriptional regulator with XRE-family HTH domain